MRSQNASRQALLMEIEALGIDADCFHSLTIDQLSDLLFDLNKAANPGRNSNRSGRRTRKEAAATTTSLSAIDKKILKALLESHGSPSSLQLSRELQIPLSTVNRRRKRLEEQFISQSYSLRYAVFGKRHITFIISLGAGDRSQVAKEILTFKGVTTITRTFGDSLDLKAEAVLETNEDLVSLVEKIKCNAGAQSVSWFESIEVLENNKDVDVSIIDSL